MSFDNIHDFFAMGGHGLYVWLSYGVGLVVLLIAACSPVLERKRVLTQLAQQKKRQENAAQNHRASGSVQTNEESNRKSEAVE